MWDLRHLGLDFGSGKEQFGTAIFEHVGHLAPSESPADGTEDDANLRSSEQKLEEVIVVFADIDDALPFRNALFEKRICHLARVVFERSIVDVTPFDAERHGPRTMMRMASGYASKRPQGNEVDGFTHQDVDPKADATCQSAV
jgi:hypothetical protein